MRISLSILTVFALAGCSIQSNRPDYQYPSQSDVSGTDWPKLAVTAELEAAGDTVKENAENNQIEAERLAARAKALKARAARLKRETGT